MDPLGLKRGTVQIYEYNPLWAVQFEEEKQRLISALNGTVTDIEHVGSTAIPGLAAKPLIDMMAVVDVLADYLQYIKPLQNLGYEFMPERVFEDRIFLPKGPEEKRTHHLNLVEKGSRQWTDSLLFRDYLRSHPAKVKEYTIIKEGLAAMYPNDRENYTKGKAAFIEQVLTLAR